MPSNRSDIMDNILSTLRAISTDPPGSYAIAPAVVEKRQTPTHPSQLPWLGVVKGPVETEGMFGHRFFNRMTVDVLIRVTDIDVDTTDDQVDLMIAAVKRAMMTDQSRGGFAHYTTWEGVIEPEPGDEKLGDAVMSFRIHWIENDTSES